MLKLIFILVIVLSSAGIGNVIVETAQRHWRGCKVP